MLDRGECGSGRAKAGPEADCACLRAGVVYSRGWQQDTELYGDKDRESH